MNNPPAFPLHNHGAQTLGLHVTGMSLRDYFAAKAMQGLISIDDLDMHQDDYARVAYQQADAMMKAREA
jgi:hypothetical protein